KGLDLLLQALAALGEKNVELSVVGKEKNLERYVKKVESLGLKDCVRFFGCIQEIKTFYSASDALVIPSMYDPFANVTVEALAMGVYVVSSSSNGGSEVLRSDIQGQVFTDIQDPHELMLCLKKALQKPKTIERAEQIRHSVSGLDYALQLGKIV